MSNIEKLLTNEEFIKWVKNPTVENDLFWREWLKSNPESEEDVNRAKNLILQITYREAPEDESRFNKVLNNILLEGSSESLIQLKADNKKRNFLKFENWIRIAAVLLFLITFAFIIRLNFKKPENKAPVQQYITKQNPFGQKSTILLPDSTVVVLNSGSSITYPKSFNGISREIRLSGEAYFEVSENKNMPFRVSSGDIITTALGTSFNVRAFESESRVSVSLNSGEVMVDNSSKEQQVSVVLNPGQKAIYDRSHQEVSTVQFDPELEFSWKDGNLVFKQTGLKEFVETIERWYGVTVQIDGKIDTESRINATFENEILENVLKDVRFSTGIDYEIDDKKVMLKIKS